MSIILIFTDLDGTLLEHRTYSFEAARPALQKIQEKHIPLIFSTSKTRAEIEYWQKTINIYHPFISENGGGIYIPNNYFLDWKVKLNIYYNIKPYNLDKCRYNLLFYFYILGIIAFPY